ncbi:hypothetical protein [Photobacterium damselae]|uniref:hypothetical protein n=1 Tax=Photobacterium damselae TaxID=38293 RepID=UPI001F297C81|nr:hypothetical protein [Photobacterium damselae]UKA04953.1 hypothetical protein IHC89_22165 [Photobacterium damselae subsp. damselae]
MHSHKRLVLVNSSASFAYVEIPLERHVLLKATGNVGKSSILNAFKLCWLPEVNFTSCERKFKFVSRQADSGFYSGDDAFNHYFPTNRSFLILECENMHGSFCQILYPRPNRGYGRIFVKSPYSDIEHLFWNKENGADGLGSPNNDLSVTAITAYLKAKDIEFENVTTKERLCQLLYSDSVIDKDSQYSVFPLKNQDRQSIKTFVSLVHAMCGAKSDNAELVSMFANIIEGQKVDQNDVLSLDLEKIMDERKELDRESADLAHLELNRADAESALSHYDVAGGLTGVGSDFVAVRDSLENQMATLVAQNTELTEEKNNCAQVVKDLRGVVKDKRDLTNSLKGELSAIKREYKVLAQRVSDGEEILSEFRVSQINGVEDLDFNADGGVFELINGDTQDRKEELSILENKEKQAQLIVALDKRKCELEEQLSVYNTQLENSSNLLINSLSEHAKIVLLSLDNRFSAIPRHEFGTGELAAIEVFCDLFELNGNKASLNAVPFNQAKSIVPLREIEEAVDVLKNDIFEVDSQLRNLKNSDVAFKESAINELRDAIKKNNDDISKLNAYLMAVKDEPIKKNELDKLQADFDKAESELSDANSQLSKAIESGKETGVKLDDVKAASDNIRALKGRLDHCRNTPCFSSLIVNAQPSSISDGKDITNDMIDGIARGFGKYQDAFNIVKAKLSNLVLNGLIDDEERLTFSSSATLSSLTPFIDSVKSKFEQVEPRRKVLADNLCAHKGIISMKMQELRGNERAIAAYKARINRMFEHFKINNLTGVKVDLNLDPRFQNLLEQANKTDLESDAEINAAFYERLEAFIVSFFKGGSKELTIDKIIKSVVFKTRKGDGEWLETGQSNSSVSLIVIPLIQSLMKDMLNPDIDYMIPMQVDEVAHIDPSQIEWLLEMLTRGGFTLLGASTHNINAQTLVAINAELNLGELRVEQAYTKERDLVLFGGIEGEVL